MGKIEESIYSFSGIDWQAICKNVTGKWKSKSKFIYVYVIYVLKCGGQCGTSWWIVCKNFMRQLQIVCARVRVCRSVYCGCLLPFYSLRRPLHILVVDAVASKFFVAYFRAGATNSFAQANELRPIVMCACVCG